jgi:hypothetical protein
MPLDEQDKMEEEEQQQQQHTLARPNIPSTGNVTLFVPDMDDFERMAQAASTPFTGNLKEFYKFSYLVKLGMHWISGRIIGLFLYPIFSMSGGIRPDTGFGVPDIWDIWPDIESGQISGRITNHP